MLGLGASLAKGGASLLTYVKDNLKLYLDFKSNRSDELKFPSEGSTSFVTGSSQYIDIGVQSSLQFASGTYAVWIYPTGNGVIYSRYVGPSYDIRWEVSGTTILCAINSVNRVTTPTDSITLNAWNHVAISISSSSILTYVNGSLIDTDSGLAIDTNAVANKIGYGDFGTYFGGKMTNLGAWSRILSLEEIQSVMNKSYSQLKGVEKTSLVAWWALDTNNGIVANNSNSEETLGSNVLSNGDFASGDLTSWSAVSGGSAMSVVNNSLVHAVGTSGGVRQAVTLTSGALYKGSFDILEITSGNNSDTTIQITIYNYAGDPAKVALTQYSVGTNTFYFVPDDNGIWFEWGTGNGFTVDNFTLKKVTSLDGAITGATTTTSVYGGNAPILPRAVDVAKEGQADAIGNGSASFNGSSDYVDISNTFQSVFQSAFTITAWIKPDDGQPSGINALFGSDSTSDQDRFRIMLKTDGKIGLLYKTDNNNTGEIDSNTTNAVFSNGATDWTHIAITVSQSSTTITGILYVNGIVTASSFSGSHEALSMADFATTTNFAIGAANRAGILTQHFDGLISQVGIWQGALTQAQIQSVMESTSYAKIPADVKSTLGSDLATSLTWTNYSFETLTSDGNSITVADNTSGHGICHTSVFSVTAGKTYKITFNFTLNSGSFSGGVIRVGTATSMSSGNHTLVTSPSNGLQTYYFTPSSSSSSFLFGLRLDSGSFNFSVSDLSIKEVTNDLVAYYPLDAVQTSNHTTKYLPDATGAVLGAELFTGWENQPLQSGGYYKGWSSFTTSGQTVTASQADEGAGYNKVFNTNAFSIVSGTAYEINITIDSRTNTYIRGFTASTNSEGSFVVYDAIWYNTTVGSAKYVLLANTTTSNARLHIRQFGANTASITISAISIKPLSGNYGRLL